MQKHWSQIGLMVSVGITAVLVLGFLGESMGIFGGGPGGSDTNRTMILLCSNPECGQNYEVSSKEFRKMMQASQPEGMIPMMMTQPVLACKFCGEESAYLAQKCKKCEAIFIPDYTGQDGTPDKCPECGYSALEEMRGNQ